MLQSVSLAELASGQVVELSIGDTLRVVVDYSYTISQTTTFTLRCGLYRRIAGVLNRIESVRNEKNIILERALTPVSKEESVDVLIIGEAEGGVADGTYGLIAEILGTDAEVHYDDCISVSGNPVGLTEMIGPLLVLGLMVGMVSMMAPMMKEGFS